MKVTNTIGLEDTAINQSPKGQSDLTFFHTLEKHWRLEFSIPWKMEKLDFFTLHYFVLTPKLCIPSTLNTALIFWQLQSIVGELKYEIMGYFLLFSRFLLKAVHDKTVVHNFEWLKKNYFLSADLQANPTDISWQKNSFFFSPSKLCTTVLILDSL